MRRVHLISLLIEDLEIFVQNLATKKCSVIHYFRHSSFNIWNLPAVVSTLS